MKRKLLEAVRREETEIADCRTEIVRAQSAIAAAFLVWPGVPQTSNARSAVLLVAGIFERLRCLAGARALDLAFLDLLDRAVESKRYDDETDDYLTKPPRAYCVGLLAALGMCDAFLRVCVEWAREPEAEFPAFLSELFRP